MLKRATPYGLLLVAISMVVTGTGGAKQIEGVQFADRYDAGGTRLPLNCVGLLRYMVFIKGYVAALYLGEGVSPDGVLADVPKRLEIDYFHAQPSQ